MHGEFLSAAGANPHPYFGAILGDMLFESGEIDRDQFDFIGEVQARTIVIAKAFEDGDKEQRQLILDRFEGTNWKTKEKTGQPDLNSAVFSLKAEKAVEELDGFLTDLAIDDLDSKMKVALEEVASGKGVHDKAASIAVLAKAFLFTDQDRDGKQALVDASLIMQFVTRAFNRIEALGTGKTDRRVALELLNTCNKLNYDRDNASAVDANQALLGVCTTEMEVDLALETGRIDIDQLDQMHGFAMAHRIKTLIGAIPEASRMYRSAGKEKLAAKVDEVHKYFNGQYSEIIGKSRLIHSEESYMELARKGAPSRDGMN